MKLIRFIAQQKPTQHCKATVLQKKKRKKEKDGRILFIPVPGVWNMGFTAESLRNGFRNMRMAFGGSLEALGELLVMLCCPRQIDDLLWSSG